MPQLHCLCPSDLPVGSVCLHLPMDDQKRLEYGGRAFVAAHNEVFLRSPLLGSVRELNYLKGSTKASALLVPPAENREQLELIAHSLMKAAGAEITSMYEKAGPLGLPVSSPPRSNL